MMAAVVQLIVLLSIWVSITVSSDMFKVVGSSLNLNFDKKNLENVKNKELKWMFNFKFMLKYASEKVEQYSAYNGRVEFNNITFNLTLKNLNKNDTGKYTLKIDDNQRENIIFEHNIIVLDSVAAPNLTYRRPQQSNDTCHVTCKSQGPSISINCFNQTCQAKQETSSDLTLFLYVSGITANCNVSNKAMWNQTTMEIKPCFPEENSSSSKGRHSGQSCAVVVITGLLVLVTVS